MYVLERIQTDVSREGIDLPVKQRSSLGCEQLHVGYPNEQVSYDASYPFRAMGLMFESRCSYYTDLFEVSKLTKDARINFVVSCPVVDDKPILSASFKWDGEEVRYFPTKESLFSQMRNAQKNPTDDVWKDAGVYGRYSGKYYFKGNIRDFVRTEMMRCEIEMEKRAFQGELIGWAESKVDDGVFGAVQLSEDDTWLHESLGGVHRRPDGSIDWYNRIPEWYREETQEEFVRGTEEYNEEIKWFRLGDHF